MHMNKQPQYAPIRHLNTRMSEVEMKANVMAAGQLVNSPLNQGIDAVKVLRASGRKVDMRHIRSSSEGSYLVVNMPNLGINVLITQYAEEDGEDRIVGTTECGRMYRYHSNGGKPIETVMHPYDAHAMAQYREQFDKTSADSEASFDVAKWIVVGLAIVLGLAITVSGFPPAAVLQFIR